MTKEEFIALGIAWDNVDWFINQCELSDERREEAIRRQEEIQQQIDDAPWECDEDGNVTPKQPA